MSIQACAEIVKQGDEARFLSAMTAKPEDRAKLFVLYAFNVEISRAAWISREELVCEMRLQFWADAMDAIENGQVGPRHEILPALVDLIKAYDLPIDMFREMIAARRWDIYRDPFENADAFHRHIDHSAGHLMWLSVLALGIVPHQERRIRDYAYGVGVANWLVAYGDLVARGRVPLIDDSHKAIRNLCFEAMTKIRGIGRKGLWPYAPALRTGWEADWVLRTARHFPYRVKDNSLKRAPFFSKGSLLIKSFLGSW